MEPETSQPGEREMGFVFCLEQNVPHPCHSCYFCLCSHLKTRLLQQVSWEKESRSPGPLPELCLHQIWRASPRLLLISRCLQARGRSVGSTVSQEKFDSPWSTMQRNSWQNKTINYETCCDMERKGAACVIQEVPTIGSTYLKVLCVCMPRSLSNAIVITYDPHAHLGRGLTKEKGLRKWSIIYFSSCANANSIHIVKCSRDMNDVLWDHCSPEIHSSDCRNIPL